MEKTEAQNCVTPTPLEGDLEKSKPISAIVTGTVMEAELQICRLKAAEKEKHFE